MIKGDWGGHSNRITRAQREAILALYLEDPIKATQLAVSHGLTPAYAYKLAHERGLIPVTRWKTHAHSEAI